MCNMPNLCLLHFRSDRLHFNPMVMIGLLMNWARNDDGFFDTAI